MRRKNPANGRRRATLTEQLLVYAPPELKRIAGQAADQEGVPLSEYVVRVLAAHLGRPDLAVVPRKVGGRPRKVIPAAS